MTLRELLVERQAAVCARWKDAVLAEYGETTAARWRRERDPFANPVGHALDAGLPELLGAAAGEGELSTGAVAALEAIVRIRSVQDLAPSRAVGFAYRLRDAMREELPDEWTAAGRAAERAELEGRIERLALRAFDVYVRLRDQVFRLRQEELKRSVASILRHWHGGDLPGPPSDLVPLSPPASQGRR